MPSTGDEAYYQLGGQHLSWGYYDHTPFIGWFLYPFLLISHSQVMLRLPTLLVSSIIGLCIYLFLRPYDDQKALLLSILLAASIHITQAQRVSDYTIDVHFFPKDAQMWGYSVSDKSFMRGSAKVEFSELNVDTLTFYLHGELKIDSIISENTAIKYASENIFYNGDYSNIGLITTIDFPNAIKKKTITVHYSGFMNPSRARSLSDYMRINKEEGVF